MSESAIRMRYAKAFFLMAKEKKMLQVLIDDVQKVIEVCSWSREFILLLESPVITSSKKEELISEIFNKEINPLTLNFLLLITRNKREDQIPGICRNFLDLTRKEQNIRSALLITASGLPPGITDKIKIQIEKELNAKVELSSKVDPEIIGGMILRIDDKQYDSSVSTQLRKIKHQLLGAKVNNC